MGHDLVAISAGTFVLKVVAQRVYRSTAQHSTAQQSKEIEQAPHEIGFTWVPRIPTRPDSKKKRENFVAVKEFNQFFDILLIRVKSEFNFTAIHLEN